MSEPLADLSCLASNSHTPTYGASRSGRRADFNMPSTASSNFSSGACVATDEDGHAKAETNPAQERAGADWKLAIETMMNRSILYVRETPCRMFMLPPHAPTFSRVTEFRLGRYLLFAPCSASFAVESASFRQLKSSAHGSREVSVEAFPALDQISSAPG